MAEADPIKPKTVDLEEVDLPDLLARVAAGEEVVLSKGGRPYVRLAPVPAEEPPEPKKQRRLGALKGIIPPVPDSVFFDPLPDDELDAWEGKYSSF